MKKATVKRFFKKCQTQQISENDCMDALFRNKFKTTKIRKLYKLYFAKEKTYKSCNFCKKYNMKTRKNTNK
jgi:hypothetical protein